MLKDTSLALRTLLRAEGLFADTRNVALENSYVAMHWSRSSWEELVLRSV